MAQNGYGPAPVVGHVGRIPNFGKTQVNPMGTAEPPACIQNAMMTKDKKPFTYTPGGLDLSQIRTPSMARRLARQRSLEDQEQQYGQQNAGPQYRPQGGPVPPPPPPQMPAPPPPPPPIVIQVPDSKSPKPVPLGERPEIVIPDNPIGMLRKTNSPYHWEAEKAELQRMGSVPKYTEKVPSPLTVKMPPSSFTQQQPQTYSPQISNNQRQGYPYNQNTPESPVHRPAAQYGNQISSSPNMNGPTPTREMLQRQDSQFNKSPQPYTVQSPVSNGSPYSPSPNNNWRQPERRDSPAKSYNSQSPQTNRGPFSPQFSPNTQQHSPNTPQYSPSTQNQSPPSTGPAFHTLPRAGPRNQESYGNNIQNNNVIYNNTREESPKVNTSNSTPWRTNTLNRNPKEQDNLQEIYHNSKNVNQQPTYTPPWKLNEANNNNTNIPPWKQDNKNLENQTETQQQGSRWAQDSNNNKVQDNYTSPWKSRENEQSISPSQRNQQEPRFQSTMSIPVTPRKQNSQPEYNNTPPQREAVYVNQEPVYYCPESPKSMPPWVKTQKEKTKTPPPTWVQKPLERKSAPRELVTPPRETNQEPEWVKKSNDMQRAAREVISPPKYQQAAQPAWSTRPSENRKSLPRDNAPTTQGRIIPIQVEMTGNTDQGRNQQQPQLRVVINMQQEPNAQGQNNKQAPFSQPTQRIMRVLSPQLVRLDDGPAQQELPSLNRSFQNTLENQPKTRIIPIQIEGGNSGANKSFGGRY